MILSLKCNFLFYQCINKWLFFCILYNTILFYFFFICSKNNWLIFRYFATPKAVYFYASNSEPETLWKVKWSRRKQGKQLIISSSPSFSLSIFVLNLVLMEKLAGEMRCPGCHVLFGTGPQITFTLFVTF